MRVEVYDADPGPDQDPWALLQCTEFGTAAVQEVRIGSLMSDFAATVWLGPAASWMLRAHRSTADGSLHEPIPDGTERWLLQLWPSGPPQVNQDVERMLRKLREPAKGLNPAG